VEDSPADEAGLEQGDIITAVDGEAVTTPTELVDVVSATEPGDTLTLTVERDGETLEIESTVEMSQPESFIVPDEDSADAVDDDDLLDTLDELQLEEPRPRLGIAVDTNAFNGGVAIINVVEGSPADDAGLLRGDVITAVDGEPISTPTALIDIVAAAEPDQTLTLTIERDNETLEVEATVEMGHAGTYFHHNDEREDDN
jgi:serine protease Do